MNKDDHGIVVLVESDKKRRRLLSNCRDDPRMAGPAKSFPSLPCGGAAVIASVVRLSSSSTYFQSLSLQLGSPDTVQGPCPQDPGPVGTDARLKSLAGDISAMRLSHLLLATCVGPSLPPSFCLVRSIDSHLSI